MVSRFSKPKSTYVCCFDVLRNICIRENVDCHESPVKKTISAKSSSRLVYHCHIPTIFHLCNYIYIIYIYIYMHSHEYPHEYSHLKLHLFGGRRPHWQNTPPAANQDFPGPPVAQRCTRPTWAVFNIPKWWTFTNQDT